MLESDLKIQHCDRCSAMRQQCVKNTLWTSRCGGLVKSRRRIVWGYATGDARLFTFKKKVPPCTGRNRLRGEESECPGEG